MIESIAASRYAHGTIVELSCGPHPVNVHGPVLFCLALGVSVRAEQIQAALGASVASAEAAAQRDTWWDRVTSTIAREPTWRSIAASHYARAFGEYQALESLIEPSNRLLEEIGELPRF
jgi:hypothetical protein